MIDLAMASAPGTIERPEVDDGSTSFGELWTVVVFDNDYNTVEQVVDILMAATACSVHEAEMEAWEIHHLGKSCVHHGDHQVCASVAEIIATIGIRVEVLAE